MNDLKRKIQNGLIGALVYGGMTLFGGVSILSGAYLHHTQPKAPQIISEYRRLNQEQKYLTSIKQFSLEEALNQIYIQEQSDKADSLSEQIKAIESSEEYTLITKHKEENSRHNKYWLIPFASMVLGASSMLYGVHLESKINSRPSTK